jgi:hypothetical protein
MARDDATVGRKATFPFRMDIQRQNANQSQNPREETATIVSIRLDIENSFDYLLSARAAQRVHKAE